MKQITALTEYRGTDMETGEDLHLREGDTREVSDDKARQLQRDFPDWFQFEGDGSEIGEDRKVELGKENREPLNEIAESLGVPNPAGLPNKPAVIDQILLAENRWDELAELTEAELGEVVSDAGIDPDKFEDVEGLLAEIISIEMAPADE